MYAQVADLAVVIVFLEASSVRWLDEAICQRL